MNGTTRALLGAAVGAVLTLLLHPVSRPFLSVVFWHPPAIDSSKPLPGALPRMSSYAPHETLLDASIWMQAASERLTKNMPLGADELADSRDVALAAAKVEPDNAFWKQMAAVFETLQGKKADAESLWQKASQCTAWNDLQTKRLQLMQEELARRYGSWQSWQLGRVYTERSIAPAEVIQEAARKRLDDAPLNTAAGCLVRFDVILNGNLIRKGGQSLATDQIGASLVELSCHPDGMSLGSSSRKMLKFRDSYLTTLKSAGYIRQAEKAQQIYRDNDSWTDFLNEKDASGNLMRLALASVVVSTLPSAMLAISIIGLAIWAFGMIIPRFTSLQAAFCFPAVFSVGLVLALYSYAITSLPLAGIALGLCTSFLAFTPKHERRRHPEILGPFFKFATGFLAAAFIVLACLFFMVRTPPNVQTMAALDLQQEGASNAPSLAGLALLVIGLVLLAAPFWAFAQRIRTTLVLSLGLRSFGAMVGTICLAGSIILCPMAVYADRALGKVLNEIVTNEQVHYYLEKG